MTPEQIQEIVRLRGLNLSPKQIARKLGLRPAEVSAWLKNQAQEAALSRKQRGELAPLEQCFINQNAAQQLLAPQKQDKGSLKKADNLSEDGAGGLAQIFVTRKEGNQYLIASYLVDYWCLGVKDAWYKPKLNRQKYEAILNKAYSFFPDGKQEITLEQAQAIVFGAVEYAAQLGFTPHQDFEEAKANLGTPLEHLPSIEFGRDGKPCYISGPYDNPERIVSKLQQAVGEGNFNYIVPL